MKVYDPAFEAAARAAADMAAIRFVVQIHHLHTNNSHHLAHFRLHRTDDLPADAIERTRAARAAAVREAIGEVPAHVQSAFGSASPVA